MNFTREIAIISFLLLCWIIKVQAQDAVPQTSQPNIDSNVLQKKDPYRAVPKRDVIDALTNVLHIHHTGRTDTGGKAHDHMHVAVVPALGYTMLTGFAGILAANAVFTTAEDTQSNLSNILTSFTYSQYKQMIFPIQSNIWTRDNLYNISTDWRYLQYPSYTYGLGGKTRLSRGYSIDYSYVRFYQTVSRRMVSDLYAGVGYDYDYLWNIREIDPPAGKKTGFEKYGFSSTEVASGITASLLFDSRQNPVNPDQGYYAHIVYRPNFTFLGSSSDWQSLQIDLRRYIRLSSSSENVLAFWSFDWLTLHGHPPYLLLPATGWDPYNNTGRGYVQGRFRGKNMLYLESEYRFGITRNGLLGGVIFANAESFSQPRSGYFDVIALGYGLGLRLKLNKFSKTNLALDYGFGSQGSRGFAVNLGEVF